MLFASPLFLFIFLPAFMIMFFVSGRYRDYVLLAGSLIFYVWGEPIFCFIAICSAIFDYKIGDLICRSAISSRKAKLYLAVGIIANIAILFYYKYTNFFIATLSSLTPNNKFHFNTLQILLPIGVSFIVFEKITYIVDLYRRVGEPAKNLLSYLNYVFLFPKLLAGPIIKYHEIDKQFRERTLNAENFFEGFKRFLRGLIKKVFIADTCAEIADQVFALQGADLGFGYAWLGMLCFTLQIYFDFSGYSDMALGLARLLGFELKENFNLPYIATSFTDFWRRWHISLSTWIKEYLYIPLGGNQGSKTRVYFNLWICFLLSGLWHGASWTFVLWGAYHGLFLILDKLFWLNKTKKLPYFFRASVTLILVMFGWVIFRSKDFNQVIIYLQKLISPLDHGAAYIDITNNIWFMIVIGSMISIAAMLPGYDKLNKYYLSFRYRLSLESLFFAALGLLAICKVVGMTYHPFLYFRF